MKCRTMIITDQDIPEFRQRAKTELKSGCDCGRLRWDDVVVALCDEVEKLRYTLEHYFIHSKFSQFTEDALNAVNKIYDLVSNPCVVLEDVFQACQQARSILYNPPVSKTPPRACDVMSQEDLTKVVTDGILHSLETRPDLNIIGAEDLVKVIIATTIKCAYDTELRTTKKDQ